MRAGRPLKFKTVKTLQKAIDAYFASCWAPKMRQRLKDGIVLPRGQRATPEQLEWVQERDWNDEPLFEQVRPYSVTGLAMALDTSRQTLVNYEERDGFFDAVKAAKLKCENFVEEGLMKGAIPPAPGIFNLKNNYEWKDEITQTLKHENLTDLIKDKLEARRRLPQKNTRRS